MKANYVEGDGQMSPLPFRNRTRIRKLKPNMRDSENHTQKIISIQAILRDDCTETSQKEKKATLCCKPLFKWNPTFKERQMKKNWYLGKLCMGVQLKGLLNFSILFMIYYIGSNFNESCLLHYYLFNFILGKEI